MTEMKPTYLTAKEIAAILKITRSGAYKVIYKLAAQGAEVIKLAGIRINEKDFWKHVKQGQV